MTKTEVSLPDGRRSAETAVEDLNTYVYFFPITSHRCPQRLPLGIADAVIEGTSAGNPGLAKTSTERSFKSAFFAYVGNSFLLIPPAFPFHRNSSLISSLPVYTDVHVLRTDSQAFYLPVNHPPSSVHTPRQPLQNHPSGHHGGSGRRRSRRRKCWTDNAKEWTSLPS